MSKVFKADSRCNQFRVKVGHSFIHEILQNVYMIDLDSVDKEDLGEDWYYIQDGYEDEVFAECANAVDKVINRFIKNPVGCINDEITEEIGEVVLIFKDIDIITSS